KRYRHLFFAYVQARKDIVLCWYKVGFHRAPPLFLVLSNRTLITGGPLRGLDTHHTSLRTGDDLQGAAAVRAVFHIDIEEPFEQSRPTDARRRPLRVSVLA